MLYVGIAILFCIVLKHLLLVDDTVTVPYHFIITRKSFVEGSNLFIFCFFVLIFVLSCAFFLTTLYNISPPFLIFLQEKRTELYINKCKIRSTSHVLITKLYSRSGVENFLDCFTALDTTLLLRIYHYIVVMRNFHFYCILIYCILS